MDTSRLNEIHKRLEGLGKDDLKEYLFQCGELSSQNKGERKMDDTIPTNSKTVMDLLSVDTIEKYLVDRKKSWAEGTSQPSRPKHIMEGLKADDGKNRLDLIPIFPLLELGKVYTLGAKKYGAHNWRKGIAYSRILGAIWRHLCAFSDGKDVNHKDGGLYHLAQAAWGCFTLLAYIGMGRTDLDDREK